MDMINENLEAFGVQIWNLCENLAAKIAIRNYLYTNFILPKIGVIGFRPVAVRALEAVFVLAVEFVGVLDFAV